MSASDNANFDVTVVKTSDAPVTLEGIVLECNFNTGICENGMEDDYDEQITIGEYHDEAEYFYALLFSSTCAVLY